MLGINARPAARSSLQRTNQGKGVIFVVRSSAINCCVIIGKEFEPWLNQTHLVDHFCGSVESSYVKNFN